MLDLLDFCLCLCLCPNFLPSFRCLHGSIRCSTPSYFPLKPSPGECECLLVYVCVVCYSCFIIYSAPVSSLFLLLLQVCPPLPHPSYCCSILVHRLAAVFVPARSPALLSPSPFFLLQQQQVVCGPDSLPFAATLELISFPRLCLGWQYPVSGSRFFGVPPTYAVIAR
eukprot:RCo054733